MAGIDKTYCSDYKQYRAFKDWADKQFVTFFDGHTECIGHWVYELTKEEFQKVKEEWQDVPIMNTPTWMDIYLVQNCPFEFVVGRMEAVYSEESFKSFSTINLSAPPPEDYQQNRKIRIVRNKRTLFPLHNKSFKGNRWWLQCNNNFSYCDYTKKWVHYDFPYPHNTNTAHLSTIKSIIKHLRKQYLPKGITFTISGRYIGENYTIFIH